MVLGNGEVVASQPVRKSSLISSHKFKPFKFEELKKAVGTFDRESMIGKGGFSLVYKGTLPGNKPIAVKWLDRDKTDSKHFESEIQILGDIEHPNLVKMLGYYCDDVKNDRLIVLDFMPNESLEFHLHGDVKTTSTLVSKARSVLKWPQRMSIASASAKAIAYLHGLSPSVIHRDIKPSNVLLENDFSPKIADFGLARLMSKEKSHISSISYGTKGYVAPECKSPFKPKYTDKSDVFAFGILLLELITGKKSVFPMEQNFWDHEDTYLSIWVVENLKVALQNTEDKVDEKDECDYSMLVDANLGKDYKEDEMGKMIYCAAAAVYKPKDERPPMKDIVEVLEGTLLKEWIWDHEKDKFHLRNPYYDNIVRAFEN